MIRAASLFFLAWSAAGAASDLPTVLAKMDAAADSFEGLSAELRWVTHVALIDDTTVEEGEIILRRRKDGDFNVKISLSEPGERYITVDGTDVEIYKPKIALIEQYDLSNSKDRLEQALLLGFGVSGRAIQKDYVARLAGEEEVSGERTFKLELTPKPSEKPSSVQKIEMWVSAELWQPIQQKIYTGTGGDYKLYSYDSMVVNPPLKDSDFKLKVPRNVKRTRVR